MSLFNRLGGMVKSAFERDDIGVAGMLREEPVMLDEAIRPTATRYAAVKEAVERRINSFLRRELVSHLEIGFNEIFVLHYIEICADSQGKPQLQLFLKEFSPDARVDWVKKLLGPAIGQHVNIDQFMGLDQEFSAADLAETDPFEEELNHAPKPLYRITLHGRWDSRKPAAFAGISEIVPPRVSGPMLRLTILDAKADPGAATREIEIGEFPAVLGSSAQADIAVSGYYVSALHCTLYWNEGRVWLEDHSTNGTWLDGHRLQRGTRVVVGEGAALSIGRVRGDAEYQRYPALRVHGIGVRAVPGANHTPVAPPANAAPIAPEGATPIAVMAVRNAMPLALLAIVDATGNPKRDVLKLPFSVGRGSAQDYVVPDANEGVSREHLLIESIDQNGAITRNLAVGKNGTFSGHQSLPERFTWRFGEELVLAEKWTSAPAVRLILRRVEQ
jgi:pSer/pThr/pTyr-binding forkhead associated (FHA) protein